MLDYRACTWLVVDDANRLEVVAFPAETGGRAEFPTDVTRLALVTAAS